MFPQDLTKLAEDIREMRIRGAAEIGRTAAEGLAIAATHIKTEDPQEFMDELEKAYRLLLSTRP